MRLLSKMEGVSCSCSFMGMKQSGDERAEGEEMNEEFHCLGGLRMNLRAVRNSLEACFYTSRSDFDGNSIIERT